MTTGRALFYGITAMIATLLGATASAEINKLSTYSTMRAIAREIESIKGNHSLIGRANELQAQFDALKASMGGDDATSMNEEIGSRASAAPLAAPAPGPGFAVSTTTVNQTTPLAIPTGPAVITSTLVVAGAGAYLWDVDVITNLTHSFAADLDITIQSPAGTVVTLTTDNGAGNDNVFNGTLWDDQANDPVTDHLFGNGVLASPLIPEEALGAFRGENPNGTWTITVSDDLAGDGGNLSSWGLTLFTLPQAPAETSLTYSNATPVAIADVATVTSTILVSGTGTSITAVDATTFIRHTFAADLDISLQSPSGTVVKLTTDNGAGNDDVFNGTNWNDKANSAGQVPYTTNNGLVTDHAYVSGTPALALVPEGAMSALVGEDPNGTWTLIITDDLTGDVGTLDDWSLHIVTGRSGGAVAVPAVGLWGLGLLAGLLAGLGGFEMRRKRR